MLGADVLHHGFVHLATQPDKGFFLVLELGFQLGRCHLQQFGQLTQLDRIALQILRVGPNAGRWHAGGQQHTVAVQHAAAVGGQGQGPGKAHLALADEEIVVNDLHMGGSPHQSGEAQGHRRHDQFAAPNRCFAGQQGAGAELHAAYPAHGVPPCLASAPAPLAGTAGLAAPVAVTYWVMAGETLRICSCTRAIFSTRSGVV